MRRLIDANAIPWEEHYVPDGDVQWEYKKELCVLKPVIDAMPTVDAVEVVRCKDCKHYVKGDEKFASHCRLVGAMCDDDDFCSCGERRTDGK